MHNCMNNNGLDGISWHLNAWETLPALWRTSALLLYWTNVMRAVPEFRKSLLDVGWRTWLDTFHFSLYSMCLTLKGLFVNLTIFVHMLNFVCQKNRREKLSQRKDKQWKQWWSIKFGRHHQRKPWTPQVFSLHLEPFWVLELPHTPLAENHFAKKN